MGTDRNLSNSLLEHRAELLASLVKFFHRDIQTMHDQFVSAATDGNLPGGSSYKTLSDKLYHIFETYLPILQYNGNKLQNNPISRLPKVFELGSYFLACKLKKIVFLQSASNIFLDAMQTLQSCQQTKGVLGGSLLFHNK